MQIIEIKADSCKFLHQAQIHVNPYAKTVFCSYFRVFPDYSRIKLKYKQFLYVNVDNLKPDEGSQGLFILIESILSSPKDYP